MLMKRNNYMPWGIIIVLINALLFVWVEINQATALQHENKKLDALAKAMNNDHYTTILINSIMSYYSNNGSASYNPYIKGSGFEFPKGSDKEAIFADGLVWGGIHNGTLKVGGSTFRNGLQAGEIITPGTPKSQPVADDPGLTKYRVFRVRPDINPLTLFATVQDKINDELPYISRYESYTAAQLFDSYIQDWNEWPAADGAPFKDNNGNGLYDPSVDVPGVPGADQTLWHVSNDLDSSRTINLYGSPPIGLEFQRTIWAYHIAGALSNIIFVKYKIINKSGFAINDMYLSQWADPDIGDADDDYLGCDTTLSLGYVYNSIENDPIYESKPPAAGFDFFQGPIVPGLPTDQSIFDGRYRDGFKNLPLSSINFFNKSDNLYSDPVFGDIRGTSEWYNLMQGLISTTGDIYIDPFSGQPTMFVLTGDPVTRQGWIDGSIRPPADRRLVMTTGPFTMADGDTQEVVVAALVGQGSDRLSSITALRKVDRIAQSLYNTFFTAAPPTCATRVSYPNDTQTTVHITAAGGIPRADMIHAKLQRYDGTTLIEVDLYDDGMYNDEFAHDEIFANNVTFNREYGAIYLDIDVTAGSNFFTYDHLVEPITIAGPLEIIGPMIFSDNLNNDHIPNPGENIRYGFTILNSTVFDLQAIIIRPNPDELGRMVEIPQLEKDHQYAWTYDATNPNSYFSFVVPDDNKNFFFPLVISIEDTVHNEWVDTLRFSIKKFSVPVYGIPVTHTAGKSDWSFSTLIIDRSTLTDHTYQISIEKYLDEKVINLRDLDANRLLLSKHPFPDESGHNIPVMDGFKVLQSENWGRAGLNRDSTRWISSSPVWFKGYRFTSDSHTAFDGGVTTGYQLGTVPYLGQFASNFDYESSVRVEVRFDATNPQKAYRLRRSGPNTEYQLQTSVCSPAPNGEPFVDIPFQVWDISTPRTPRQLTVAWRDQNDNAIWDPPGGNNDGVEIVFIYYRTYDPLCQQFTYPANPVRPGEVVDNQLTVGEEADIMYGLSLTILEGHSLNERPGILLLKPYYVLNTDDRFEFKTKIAPATPVLGSPSNGAINQLIDFWGWWQPCPGADTYRLQLSENDSSFGNIIFDDSTLTVNYSPRDTINGDIVPTINLKYGTTYFWRVNAKNPFGTSDWSDVWKFTIRLALVPRKWAFRSQTGNNAFITVPLEINPRIDNNPLRTGDAVGVFFSRNDSLICAGYRYWNVSQSMTITAWGDDDRTTKKDGFASGELIRFKIWDAVAAKGYDAIATFANGDDTYILGVNYTLSSLVCITTTKPQIDVSHGIPNEFSLSQNYPNPFNPITCIKYGLPQDCQVKLEIFNILGQRVALIINEKQKAGFHEAIINESNLSSAIYFYRLSAGLFVKIKKMTLLK